MNSDYTEARSLATLLTLRILQDHSDADHCLTQSQIIEYLKNEYGVIAERKKVARDIERLEQANFEICRGESGQGYYLLRDFDDSELRLLIDSVLYSKHIPARYSESLVKKLTDLGGPKFRKKYRFFCSSISRERTENAEVFLNIETINDAIERKDLIRFQYYEYGIDAQLHPVWEKAVTVIPLSLVISNGHYCMMAKQYNASDKTVDEEPAFFYLDRMKEVQKKQIPYGFPYNRQETEFEKILDEHPLGFTGKSVHVSLRLIRSMIDDLIEIFGRNYTCIDHSDETAVTVNFRAGEKDVLHWVMQNAPSVELLEPLELRERIAKLSDETREKHERPIISPDRKTIIANALGKDGVLRLHRIDLTKDDLKDLPAEKIYGAEFSFNDLDDFSFLEKYQKLRYVKIESDPVTDLSVLAKLPELERLELYFLEDLGSLAFLRECRKLRKLNLINNDLPADDDPPFYDMPWLQVLNASARDLRDIDMHELYANNPHLSVQTELEDIFGSNDGNFLWTYKDWDEHRPQTYPFGASVFASIFGMWELEDYPRGYMDWLENNRGFQNVLDKVFLRLGRNEYTAFADWILGKSIREISRKILLSCEAVVCLQAGAFRILRHPTSARLLKPFGPSCSPFADEYRENLRKKGRL